MAELRDQVSSLARGGLPDGHVLQRRDRFEQPGRSAGGELRPQRGGSDRHIPECWWRLLGLGV